MGKSAVKKPSLDGLRGSFVFSRNERTDLKLPPGILNLEARKWTSIDDNIHAYFKTVSGRVPNGDEYYKKVLDSLRYIILNETKQEAVKRYAIRIQKFYKEADVRREVTQKYDDLLQQARPEKRRQMAITEGRITGAAHAESGARELAMEVSCERFTSTSYI